jgi:hypothetical protein
MAVLPSFVRQPNDGFVEERVPGGEAGVRLSFNVNKYARHLPLLPLEQSLTFTIRFMLTHSYITY